MAARSRKVQHDAKTREKIRTSQLLNRLHAYALNENDPQNGKPVKLDNGQIKAIEILLRKSMPDLQSIEGDFNVTNSHEDALSRMEQAANEEAPCDAAIH